MEIEKHYNLVPFVIRRYFKDVDKDEFEDYMQEGYIGLIEAGNRYNPSKGEFTSYACAYIKDYIYWYRRKYAMRIGGMRIKDKRIKESEFKYSFMYLSDVETEGNENDDKRRIDRVMLDDKDFTVYSDSDVDLKSTLTSLDEKLTKKEKKVWDAVYGYYCKNNCLNRYEIAKELGVTHQAISKILIQIEDKYDRISPINRSKKRKRVKVEQYK